LAVVGAVGFILLVFSDRSMLSATWDWKSLFRDLARDLGLAFIVSSIVAGLFEIYRSQNHTFDGMKAVIDATLGEQISPEGWLELKELIAAKECIRRRARIRLEFTPDTRLHSHQRKLSVEYDYELHALTSKTTQVGVTRELDYQLRNAKLNLPQFTQIVTRGSKARVYATEDLKKFSAEGRFSAQLALSLRNGEPCTVRTRRSEIVNFPGSYNLYTPEFMKGVSITVVNCPPEFNIDVLVRPLGKGQLLNKADNTWSCDHLLMPGQGIEVKMQLASTSLFDGSGSQDERIGPPAEAAAVGS
jgi:hypothetical protein